MKLTQSFLACLLALIGVSCASHPPMKTASYVDLPKFMGPWRVIASTNNKIEKDFVDAVDSYALRDDKKTIDVTFTHRDKSFDAPLKTQHFKGRVIDLKTNAYWTVKLIPFIPSDYMALYVDPSYEWAVMGHPSRKFGWILARERTVSDEVYDNSMKIFKEQGYDTSIFKKVPQVKP